MSEEWLEFQKQQVAIQVQENARLREIIDKLTVDLNEESARLDYVLDNEIGFVDRRNIPTLLRFEMMRWDIISQDWKTMEPQIFANTKREAIDAARKAEGGGYVHKRRNMA